MDGRTYLTPLITKDVLWTMSNAVDDSAPTLTPREIQVMELVSEGRRNKEIAATLGISEETVQVHLKNIFAKLKVSERTAAVNVALRRGIVHIR